MSVGGRTAGHYGGSRRIRFAAAQKTFHDLGLYLNNFLGDKAVGLAVNVVRCLRIRGLNETENLAATVVNPILEVINPVILLHCEIGLVRLRDLFRGDPAAKLVNGHVCWHTDSA